MHKAVHFHWFIGVCSILRCNLFECSTDVTAYAMCFSSTCSGTAHCPHIWGSMWNGLEKVIALVWVISSSILRQWRNILLVCFPCFVNLIITIIFILSVGNFCTNFWLPNHILATWGKSSRGVTIDMPETSGNSVQWFEEQKRLECFKFEAGMARCFVIWRIWAHLKSYLFPLCYLSLFN